MNPYTHDDPRRDGCGAASCLLTTVLSPERLSARQAVLLYPWRREEESVFAEIKGTLLGQAPLLLRSKTPALVTQEVYRLLIGHYERADNTPGTAQRQKPEAQAWENVPPLPRLRFGLVSGVLSASFMSSVG